MNQAKVKKDDAVAVCELDPLPPTPPPAKWPPAYSLKVFFQSVRQALACIYYLEIVFFLRAFLRNRNY
jgi:hypothetical protein